MAFSETVDLLVVARADGAVESWRVGAPSTVRVVRSDPDDPVLDLAADGPRILGVTARRLLVWNARMELEAERPLDHPAHFVATTPRNVWLAGDTHVVRLGRDLGEARWTPIPQGETTDFDVHPSEKRLVVVKDGRTVHVHDGGTGAELHVWGRKERDLRHLSVRFAGKPDHLWEVVNRGWTLHRVSAKTGRRVRVKDEQRRPLMSAWAGPLAFCPDRRHLAVLQTGCDVQIWDLGVDRPVYYAEPVVDRSQEKPMASLSRVPKFASAGPGVVRLTTSRRRPSRDAAVTALAVASGGTMVALGDREGTVHRCDTRTGAIERLGMDEWVVAPRCVAVTRWDGDTAHGVRDGERWIVRQGRLMKLDFDRLDQAEGVLLEGCPDDLEGSVRRGPSLFFRGGLVWYAGYRDLWAWEAGTGRLAWHAETPGRPHIAGDAAYLIEGDASYGTERFRLVRIDLDTREVGAPGDFEIGRPAIDLLSAPVNWPRLCTIGRHVVLELYSRPERAFLIDPERRVLLRELPPGIGDEPHDGRRVLHRVSGGYAVIDLEDPDAEPEVHRFGEPIGGVRWHVELGDGRVIGWDDGAHRVVVASRSTGELLGHFPGHGRHVGAFFVSPDERTLLSVDTAGFVRKWRLG